MAWNSNRPRSFPKANRNVYSKAEGKDVRSFQLALARLNAKPHFARFLIHQPGPLFDYPEELDGYCDVYINGMHEVERLLNDVVARPL